MTGDTGSGEPAGERIGRVSVRPVFEDCTDAPWLDAVNGPVEDDPPVVFAAVV